MKPLEIHVKCPNGEFENIVLPSDLNITFYQKNAMFMNETIPGTYTFPLRIPKAGNEKKFNFPEIINNAERPNFTDSQVFANGNLFLCGQTLMKKASSENYSINFTDNKGEFFRSFRDNNLRDCADVEFETGCPELDTCRLYEIENTTVGDLHNNFVIYINGVKYGPTVDFANTPGVGATVQSVLDTLIAHINNNAQDVTVSNGGGSSTPTETGLIEVCGICNLPLVIYDVSTYGFNQTIPLVNDVVNDYNQCFIDYLNNLLINPEDSHVFPTYINIGAYNDLDGFTSIINPYSLGTYLANSFEPRINIHKYSWSPIVSKKWLLEKIAEKTGFTIKGDLLNDPCFCKDYFMGNCLIDKELIWTDYDQGDNWEDLTYTKYSILVPDRKYNLKNCIPDITIEEFLKGLEKQYCAYITFDDFAKCININLHKDALKKEPIKDAQKIICGTGELCFGATGYELKNKKPKNEKKWTGDNVLIVGDGSDEIEGIFSVVETTFINLGGGFFRKLPCIFSEPSTDTFLTNEDIQDGETGFNEMGAMSVLYHGLVAGYPFASSDDIDINGNAVDPLNRCSLKWDGEHGMYNQYFKQWIAALMKGVSIPIDVLPDSKFLLSHKSDNVYYLKINGVYGCYLFKELRTTFNSCGVGKSKAILQYLPPEAF